MSAPRNDTFSHTTPIKNGELRVSVVHSRIHETFKSRDSRIPVTAAMEIEEAERHFQRGLELIALAKAARVSPIEGA